MGHEGWLSAHGLLGGQDLSNLLGWVGWGGVGEGLVAEETSWWEVGMGTAQSAEGPLQVWELRTKYLVCERSEVSSGLGVSSF